MSSTKRTPDEPGRGSVATGQHPVEPNGAAGTAEAAGNGAGNGNGRANDAATRPGASSAGSAEPEQAKSDGSAVTGSDIVTAEVDGTGASSGTPAADGAPAVTPDAATTARFRLPSPADTARGTEETARFAPDTARPAAAKADPTRPVTATPEPARDGAGPTAPGAGTAGVAQGGPSAGGDATAAPTLDPVPAPAVPAPGPGAAQPPPWRRMPGFVAAGHPDVPTSQSTADRLLDEGPTAFLEAPRYAAQSPGPTGTESAVNETGWARASRSRPPRQAALQLKRLDPWSVLKLALVLAVVLFFIWLVAVGVLYGVLDGMGVWDRLNGTYADLVSGEAQTGNTLISAGRVFGLAAVVGAINSLLFAVAVTVGAFVYNVSADLVGGIEVTLSERD